MAAINFPHTPNNDDIYTVNGFVYQWNGVYWKVIDKVVPPQSGGIGLVAWATFRAHAATPGFINSKGFSSFVRHGVGTYSFILNQDLQQLIGGAPYTVIVGTIPHASAGISNVNSVALDYRKVMVTQTTSTTIRLEIRRTYNVLRNNQFRHDDTDISHAFTTTLFDTTFSLMVLY